MNENDTTVNLPGVTKLVIMIILNVKAIAKIDHCCTSGLLNYVSAISTQFYRNVSFTCFYVIHAVFCQILALASKLLTLF